MSLVEEIDKGENPTFKWGKKRGTGGAKKEYQFYESFTFDEIEYFLHDCVYLYKDGELEPYVGKIIKIWEQPSLKKKVKILWFFRPIELQNYLRDDVALENELFLASGDGVGLANVNPLEAIAGKCNVVCISKDERNPQPSDEEKKMADFIFFRTFDVGKLMISDKMDDVIAGVDVRFIFNKRPKTTDNLKSEVPLNDNIAKEVASNSTRLPSSFVIHGSNEDVVKDDKFVHSTSSVATDVNSKASFLQSGKHDLDGRLSDDNYVQSKKIKVEDDKDSKGSKALADDRMKLKPAELLPDGSTIQRNKDNNVQRKKTKVDDDRDSKGSKAQADDRKKGFTVDDLDKLDNGLSKKLKVSDNSSKSEEVSHNVSRPTVADNAKASEVSIGSSEGKLKPISVSSSIGRDIGMLKKVKLDQKKIKPADESLQKTAAAPDRDIKTNGQVVEVTRRPDVDRSKWFKGIPWKERMDDAHRQGTLVLLENLDPSYISSEIEDIIWHGFRETCTAKVVNRTMISSPYSGRALAIFKTKEAAEMVIRKLEQECLMLPNGRPLVGSKGIPIVQGKHFQFCGHLVIDKIRLQMQREDLKKAVSTSHCSQPNTIEYEMAMEWKLLQAKSDTWWKDLYKQQGEELRKLKSGLKNK